MDLKPLLFFLTTDPYASPFDITVAYDAGFHSVITYGGVSAKSAASLTNDIIFPRGPAGNKFSSIYVGGSDLDAADEVLRAVQKSMFPPFQVAIMADPKGAFTTAGAVVARGERAMASLGKASLSGLAVTVLGGAGAVGRTVGSLAARQGARVHLVDVNEEALRRVAAKSQERPGVSLATATVRPEAGERDLARLLEGADLICACGPPATPILPKSVTASLPSGKAVIDINAIPPVGVEGLEANDDLKEIAAGVRGIGALVVGKLKSKVHRLMLEKLREADKPVVLDEVRALEETRGLLAKA